MGTESLFRFSIHLYVNWTLSCNERSWFLQRGDILRGLETCMLLEETGEVLRVFEAEGVGGLADGEAADQQTLGTVNEKALYDLHGTLPGDASHHVAEVTGRQAEFGGTVFHVGQAVLPLQAMFVIVGKHLLKSRQQVALSAGGILKLTMIKQPCIVTHQQDIVLQDAVGLWRLTAVLDEPPDHPHQLPHQLLLALCGMQGLVHVV